MARTAKKNNDNLPSTLRCVSCGSEISIKELYGSNSELYKSTGKLPWCKDCIDKIYYDYLDKYKVLGYAEPEKKAIERMCMFLDVYYCDKVYESAMKQIDDGTATATPITTYLKIARLSQYRSKGYDKTLEERYNEAKIYDKPLSIYSEEDSDVNKKIEEATKIFGGGFSNDDYVYLYDEYCDWTARNECNTKAQEEVFKNICLTQLQYRKATLSGSDTDKLGKQLQQWLDTGKLQPKQNASDTMADNQTFGTLIDKWENTRPIPDCDEELKDVDKIGLYIDVFFKGHLAKMVGIKNGFSNLYDRFMKKYTVEKPEYRLNDDDDVTEPMFDAIFGKSIDNE